LHYLYRVNRLKGDAETKNQVIWNGLVILQPQRHVKRR
jgi:hypothetical protein